MDPELEELPTDYMRGLDFRISKTTKGGYADYSTSKWARKESALTEEELAAIEQHGLFTLSDFLPKKPTDVELKIMKEMFEASVDGQPYDIERWGSYFRPAGLLPNEPSTNSNTTAKAVPAVVDTDPPFDVNDEVPAVKTPVQASPASSNQSAQDILAMIRARQKQ
jgi:hypothetical protein